MPTTTIRNRAGSDRRHRERRALSLILAVFALFLIGGAGGIWLLSEPAPAPAIGGPFRLTASDGREVTDQDFRGKYLLIYFGYTYCPDVCPTTLQSVAAALDTLGAKAAKLQPLLITVDPGRDTPAVLARYTAAFSPRLLGLSGTAAEIGAVEKEYRIYAAIHRTGPGQGDYTVDHSSVLYLMGPDGRLIAPLKADSSSDQIADTILHYMS